MTRQLMGAQETRQYLRLQHGISRSRECVYQWMRQGLVLPVASYGLPDRLTRLTTPGQVDAAVGDGRVPPDHGRRRTRRDRRNEVAAQLMDELGLTLAEGDKEE
jgi:hypothetical protein